MAKIIYIENDNILRLDALKNDAGDFVSSATVTATMLDSIGEEVAGQEWPLSMPYVAESDGRYEGIIESTVEIDDGGSYTVNVDALLDQTQAHWELALKAKVRKG